LADQIKEKAVVEAKLKTFAKSGGDGAEILRPPTQRNYTIIRTKNWTLIFAPHE
jgi:hypothetical protein